MSQRKPQTGNRNLPRSGSRSDPQASSDAKIQQVKLVLLGDQGVGKSSIALRFVRGEYTEHGEATVGAAFLTQTVHVQSHAIKFDIWDTAGQERYHSLAPMYYRGAQAAIVVYDVTNPETFTRAITWITELKQQANPHIVIVLAGNKADQAAETRAVLTEDARTYAEEHELIFTETSAKTGMAVQELFLTVAQSLTQQPFNKTGNGHGVKLKSEQDEKKTTCC